VPQFGEYVASLKFGAWRPSFVTVHNTAAPTIAQWHSHPGAVRMRNLEHYYKVTQKWSAGPHLFIADDLIWVFTPLNAPGVHSPSWNGMALGFEMVGDYSRESFTEGKGKDVRDNTIAALAITHAKLGISPDTIKLHKEDPRTTHNCPGKNVDKVLLIRGVKEYMGEAGDHEADDTSEAPKPDGKRVGVVNTDGLNMREFASASSRVLGKLAAGERVIINREAQNGSTKWLSIIANGQWAWVSARYIDTA
jgi:hypothetical protein